MRYGSIADERRHAPPERQAPTGPRYRVTGTGRYLYAVADKVQPHTKEREMAAVGKLAVVIAGLAVVAGVLIGWQSREDLNRYFRIRSM
jgi:hypothetical protein